MLASLQSQGQCDLHPFQSVKHVSQTCQLTVCMLHSQQNSERARAARPMQYCGHLAVHQVTDVGLRQS